MNAFEKLKQLITASEADAIKFYSKNNKTAGVRLRKAYQEIKNIAHSGRAEVIKLKNKD
ncbi:MAG TPA: histone H1 [Mucilaginibacter sp.]